MLPHAVTCRVGTEYRINAPATDTIIVCRSVIHQLVVVDAPTFSAVSVLLTVALTISWYNAFRKRVGQLKYQATVNGQHNKFSSVVGHAAISAERIY